MLVKTFGSAVIGINATTITIDVAQGIKFFLVGLPDIAVKESEPKNRAAEFQAKRLQLIWLLLIFVKKDNLMTCL